MRLGKKYNKSRLTERTSTSVDEAAPFKEERFLGLWVIDKQTGIEYKISAIEFPFVHSEKGQFNIYNAIYPESGDFVVRREEEITDNMPYTYKKEGDQYCVYKKDSGERVGCTDGNKTALHKYLAALHINVKDESIVNELRSAIRAEVSRLVRKKE